MLVKGLTNPESVVLNPQGQMFVSVIGERERDGDGAVVNIDDGKVVPFASGLDDPKGLVALQRWLFVADKKRVWRIDETGKAEVFDPKSGRLWAGDVGQNLWKEINIIVKGGNYGWNLREGLHPFGAKGVGPRPELIDPIWEYYHHETGKSITGGTVYRGPRLPELNGAYLYADYVTGRLWALRYDEPRRRVVENRSIASRGLPVLSFGEDEKGEVYFLTTTVTGQGIYWFREP